MKKLLITTALAAVLACSGLAYAHGDWQDEHDQNGPSMMSPFMDVLSKDKAEQFHQAMKQSFEKNAVLMDKKNELRQQLRAIITAPKFDKDAFLAKSEEMKKFDEAFRQKMEANMHEAFANGLSQLSQEDRKAIAAEMEKMHERHGGEDGEHEHHHWDHEHGTHGGPDTHKPDAPTKPDAAKP